MSERLIAKMMSPIVRSVRNMLARGTVAMANSAGKMQALQLRLLSGEAKDSIEHFEAYGFTSCPHPGAEAVTLFFAGDRSHGVAIMVADRRYRLQALQTGEVALYDDQGQVIHIKRDRILCETPKTFEVRAKDIDLYATDSFKFDVKGHGQKWLPTKIDTWQIGEVPGTANAISPPEIP